jgi:hypothetical protein
VWFRRRTCAKPNQIKTNLPEFRAFLDNANPTAQAPIQQVMSKAQFRILNIVGGVCAAVILCNLVLLRLNVRSNQSLVSLQSEMAHAQNLQNTAQNLIVRVARSAEQEPALRDLLARHEFRVNLGPATNGPAAP